MSPTHTTTEISAGIDPHPWDRQPHEPAMWYARFLKYKAAGPARTLEATYRACKPAKGTRPGASWRDAARRWDWKKRAEQYDDHQERQAQAERDQRQHTARELRYALLDELLQATHAAIIKADLSSLSTPQARAALPTLRALLRDTLQLHRTEANATPIAEAEEEAPLTPADYQRQRDAELIVQQERRFGIDNLTAVNTLSAICAHLIPDIPNIQGIARTAGLNVERINWHQTAQTTWQLVIVEAHHRQALKALIRAVKDWYPEYTPLNSAAFALGIRLDI